MRRRLSGTVLQPLAGTTFYSPDSPLDYECGVCAGPIVARTTDGCIEFHCGSGHGFRTGGVPSPILEESVDRALELALKQVYGDLETIADGHCPRCHHRMAWGSETVGEDLGSHLLRAQCTACAMVRASPVTTWAFADWDVQARLHLAGVDLRETPRWDLRNLPASGPALATGDESAPPTEMRYRLRFDVDGPPFTVELDGTATVRSIQDG